MFPMMKLLYKYQDQYQDPTMMELSCLKKKQGAVELTVLERSWISWKRVSFNHGHQSGLWFELNFKNPDFLILHRFILVMVIVSLFYWVNSKMQPKQLASAHTKIALAPMVMPVFS